MVASCQSWLIVMNRPNNSRFPFCHGYPKSSMSWPDDHDFFSYWNKAVWLGDHPWLKHSFWGSLRADNNKNWPVAWFLFFKHTKGIFHGMTGWDDELFFLGWLKTTRTKLRIDWSLRSKKIHGPMGLFVGNNDITLWLCQNSYWKWL